MDDQPHDDNDDSSAAQRFRALQESLEALCLAPETDEALLQKMLNVANDTGDYLDELGSKDEGAYIAALELAAKVEGMTNTNQLIHSGAVCTQMLLCYTMYRQLGNDAWLRKGIQLAETAAAALSDNTDAWIAGIGPERYRKHYSIRCEKVAQGYTDLFAIEGTADSIVQAVSWQGIATDWTEPADRLKEETQEWEWKYERFNQWLRLCVLAIDKRPDWNYEGLINVAVDVCPHELTPNQFSIRCFYDILCLSCRQWAKTRRQDHFDMMLDWTSRLMKWNKDSKMFNLDNEWMQDVEDGQHVLRVAAMFFMPFYKVDDKDSRWYKHKATIDTRIALVEELRKGHKRETLGNLRRDLGPVIELRELCLQSYRLTGVVADGWRYDDLAFESTKMVSLIDMCIHNHGKDASSDISVRAEPGSYSSVHGTSVVTGDLFMTQERAADMLDWTSFRLKFRTGAGGERRPISSEDWIRGRTEDGKWLLGGLVEGKDDDVLQYIKDCQRIGGPKTREELQSEAV